MPIQAEPYTVNGACYKTRSPIQKKKREQSPRAEMSKWKFMKISIKPAKFPNNKYIQTARLPAACYETYMELPANSPYKNREKKRTEKHFRLLPAMRRAKALRCFFPN